MKFSSRLLLLLFLLAGCIKSEEKEPVVLAEVGNETLTLSEARTQIPGHIFQIDSTNAYLKYRDEWVERQVILQEADRLNFVNRAEIQEELQHLREEFIIQKVQDFIVGEFEGEVTVTEEEARNYYQQNKDKFTLDERYVQYRHLIARSRKDAEDAKRELMRGVPWETVAEQYSLYPDLKIRESQRYWPISVAGGDISMLNRFLKIIGPMEISPTHQSGSEFHFVQLTDEKAKGEHPDLDWLIEQIKGWLVLEKRKRAFNTYVKNLYLQGQANNEIKVYNVLKEQNQNEVTTDTSNTPDND